LFQLASRDPAINRPDIANLIARIPSVCDWELNGHKKSRNSQEFGQDGTGAPFRLISQADLSFVGQIKLASIALHLLWLFVARGMPSLWFSRRQDY
jgi:hypothetical protein